MKAKSLFLIEVVVMVQVLGWGQELDLEPGALPQPYSPADGSTVATNPPPFVWVPAGRGLTYALQVSSSDDFLSDETRTYRDLDISIHSLPRPLEAGKWFWRYGVQKPDASIAWSRSRSFAVPEGAHLSPFPDLDKAIASVPRARPRLFFLPGQLAEYRERCTKDLGDKCRSLCQRCDRHIGRELVPEPPYVKGEGAERGKDYQNIFRTTRPPMDAMEECGLAYLLTGEKKYGLEAKRRILHFFSWDPEGSTSLSHNDEPAMWMMMRGVRAYDWTYELFSPSERENVESVMRVRAAQFYERLHGRFESNPHDSHAGRILGFLGEASLAFCHEWPEARKWLDYVLQVFWAVYPAWGRDDGGWHEGPSYWSYYMEFVLHFVLPLRKASGVDLMEKPFFRNTPYYKLYTNPPYAKISPFGDGEHSGPSRGMGQLMYQFSALLNDPYIRWYADFMKADAGVGPLGFALEGKAPLAKSPSELPPNRYFPGVGLVSLHTKLGDPENDIHFLFHSDLYGTISHGHADENAFTIEAFGEALAIKSGYYPWYGSDHHRNWSWQTKSSNCITIDGGKGQSPHDPLAKGQIIAFRSWDEYDYVAGDATEAYRGLLTRFHRHVIHVRPGIFVIFDDLAAPEPVKYEWWLHSLSEMELDEKKQTVTVSQGNARLRVLFPLPGHWVFHQTDTFPDPPEWGEKNQWHFRAEWDTEAEVGQFVTILMVYRAGQESGLPEVRFLQPEGGMGFGAMIFETEASGHMVSFFPSKNGVPSRASASQFRSLPAQ
ncbi:MAG: DUF4962 domain-containing protein [bacterium]|nr:DUF4962 domain-containing protein [bacterium]